MALVLYTPPVINHVAAHSVHIAGAVDKTLYIGQHGRGTGKILWPAAELLSGFVADPSSNTLFNSVVSSSMGHWSWEGKNVVELGSGLGLLATTLLLLGSTVVATDGEATVVEQLNTNIATNEEVILGSRDVLMYGGMVYEWGSDVSFLTDRLGAIYTENKCFKAHTTAADTTEPGVFDVIVASDVVYGADEAVWDLLLDSIVNLTKLSVKKVLILIAQTERYKDSEDKFYSKAANVLNLEDVVDISGFASACLHPGMKSKTRLYIMTSHRDVA